ncbi:MAG: 5'/3'-nucleotidase SurE [Bdellovibrionales bacterium]|nr:5'/3'-nucleotidase SurE [Bdellovibrionales bacterium]
MKILITNDDGNQKPGIAHLTKVMEHFGQVYVVAPENDQSGTSHSLTLHEPLKFRKSKENQYVVDGTPADCIHFAIHHLWQKEEFDLCVSGINHGANIGDDVWYSGTLGGAIEAALNGIPSMAISMLPDEENMFHFERAVSFLKGWFENHISTLWPHDVVPSMNIPPHFHKDEFRYTRLGPKRYLSHIDVRDDLRGNQYFWIGGTLDDLGAEQGTDSHALANQFVSVTPLNLDVTHVAYLEKWLKK